MQGFIDLLRLYAVLIDLFQIHLFLDTLAPRLMGAGAETGSSGFFEFRFEVLHGTEIALDSRFQVALQGGTGGRRCKIPDRKRFQPVIGTRFNKRLAQAGLFC